jgi:vacuolar-type H+-ATPase subunit I/STV1
MNKPLFYNLRLASYYHNSYKLHLHLIFMTPETPQEQTYWRIPKTQDICGALKLQGYSVMQAALPHTYNVFKTGQEDGSIGTMQTTQEPRITVNYTPTNSRNITQATQFMDFLNLNSEDYDCKPPIDETIKGLEGKITEKTKTLQRIKRLESKEPDTEDSPFQDYWIINRDNTTALDVLTACRYDVSQRENQDKPKTFDVYTNSRILVARVTKEDDPQLTVILRFRHQEGLDEVENISRLLDLNSVDYDFEPPISNAVTELEEDISEHKKTLSNVEKIREKFESKPKIE